MKKIKYSELLKAIPIDKLTQLEILDASSRQNCDRKNIMSKDIELLAYKNARTLRHNQISK